MCNNDEAVDEAKKNEDCEPGGETPCETPPPKLVSITVIDKATQTNVTGAKNWATVKKAGEFVIVQAKTTPNNTPDEWSQINWSGDSGSPGDQANQRKIPKDASKKFEVKAELGGVTDDLTVWVLWADLVVKISGTIDAGNDAAGAPGHKWIASDGGGNGLGPIDCETTTLTYAYTVGSIEAKATLSPVGIEDVVLKHWKMKRWKTKNAFDNGEVSSTATHEDDSSGADWVDVDPKSGSSTREIYDLDQPGCSNTRPGNSVDHTAELYENFIQYVTVTLDSEIQCSEDKLWSYEAAVDVDKAKDKVELNILRSSHIKIPKNSRYKKR